MSWVEQLKESLPDYAKDIKLNLDAVINRSTVDSEHATYLAIAAAFATGNGKLLAFITANATDEVEKNAALTAGAITYPNTHGTANQVLSTTGSGTLTWVTPASSGFTFEVSDEPTGITAGQTSFTLSNTPGANSKVKMYINGIRISNTAYSISGTTLTYDPTKNGAYTISVGDRIQFDFSY